MCVGRSLPVLHLTRNTTNSVQLIRDNQGKKRRIRGIRSCCPVQAKARDGAAILTGSDGFLNTIRHFYTDAVHRLSLCQCHDSGKRGSAVAFEFNLDGGEVGIIDRACLTTKKLIFKTTQK